MVHGVSVIQCGLLLPPSVYVKYDRMRVYVYRTVDGEFERNTVAVNGWLMVMCDFFFQRQVKKLEILE